ncbi:MAG: hypothetical protein IK104_00525 [Clostridia bacterium]|nr:hypothetical protein [Clostridia bacterium]
MKKDKDFQYLEDLLRDPAEIMKEEEEKRREEPEADDEAPDVPEDYAEETEEPLPGKKKKSPAQKKRPEIAPKLKVLAVLLLIVAIIVGAVYGVSALIKKANSSFINGASVFYPIASDSVLSLYPYPEGVIVLTGNSVEYVDATGKLIEKNTHLYASPVLKSSGKHVLLYDKGGRDLRLEKNARVVTTVSADAEISNGAIAPNGTFAYVLNADGVYQTHIYVYTAGEKKLFEWGGPDYLIDIALSDNGKKVAFSMLQVKDASYITNVYVYDIASEKKTLLGSCSFDAEAAYCVRFLSNKEVAILTGNGVYRMNADGETETLSTFSSNELKHTVVSPGKLTAVALNLFGNEKNTEVRFFDKKLNEAFTLNYGETVLSMSASGSDTAMQFADRILVVDHEGEETGNIPLTESCYKILLNDDRVYILTANGLKCYDSDYTAPDEAE